MSREFFQMNTVQLCFPKVNDCMNPMIKNKHKILKNKLADSK